MKITNLILCLLVFLYACDKNDCDGILCNTPPNPTILKLIDTETNENLFTNGTFQPEDINIKNENNQSVNFTFITENAVNLIDLSEIGWNTGLHTYRILVGDDLEIDLKLHNEEQYEDCCSFYLTLEFDISSHEYGISNTSGFYTVKIDTSIL